jgi:MFS family permease
MSRRDKQQITLLAFLGFCTMFAMSMVFPNLNEFIRKPFRLTDTASSLFVTVYIGAHIIFAIVWGALSDKLGERKLFISFGFFATAICYFLLPYPQDYVILLVIRFLEGSTSILSFSMIMTMAIDIGRRSNYGAVMGLMGGTLTMGNTLGSPIGGAIGHMDLQIVFYLGSGLLFFCGIITLLFLDKRKPEGFINSIREAITIIKECPQLSIPYIFTFIDRFTVGFFVVIFPLFLSATFQATPATIGKLLAAFLLPFALLTFPSGILSDRFGRTIPMVGGSLIYGIIISFIGISDLEHLAFIMILGGVFAALMYAPSLALVGDLAPINKRATAMGAFNSFGSIGFAIGPFIGGVISDTFGYAASFITAGLSEILCALLAIPIIVRSIGFRKKQRGEIEL